MKRLIEWLRRVRTVRDLEPSREVREAMAHALVACAAEVAERLSAQAIESERLRVEWEQAQQARQEQALATLLRQSTAWRRSVRGDSEWLQ